jgi:hypothetical protein
MAQKNPHPKTVPRSRVPHVAKQLSTKPPTNPILAAGDAKSARFGLSAERRKKPTQPQHLVGDPSNYTIGRGRARSKAQSRFVTGATVNCA